MPLSLDVGPWYRQYINHFLPYSDFNFVSLYSYDTEADAELSVLHGNVVIKFRDYITNEPFYTFIGKENIVQTVGTLLDEADNRGYLAQLQLIPEAVIESEPDLEKTFRVTEDISNHDYILSVDELASLRGSKFANRRHQANKFENTYPQAHIHQLNLENTQVQENIHRVFRAWERGKGNSNDEMQHEQLAIKRLLEASKSFNLISVGVTIDSNLIGYAIGEVVSQRYGIFHFVKSDPDYRGVTEILYRQIGREMRDADCHYFNIEQDFSFPGLRMSKQQWNPVSMLKKYTISRG